MNIAYSKKFLKQLSELPKSYRNKIERFVFEDLKQTDALAKLGNIEKMQGYDNHYKVRFGDYRIGLQEKDGNIIIKVVMHRKKFINSFHRYNGM
jgi:mRNA interferase RelE/StbE